MSSGVGFAFVENPSTFENVPSTKSCPTTEPDNAPVECGGSDSEEVDEFSTSVFRNDVRELFPSLGSDVSAMTNWQNVLTLSVAAGAAIAIRQDLDGRIRENTKKHPDRWRGTSNTLGTLGSFTVQLPVLFGVYGLSVWSEDDELHDVALTSLNAYALTTASTSLIKVAANTDRPSDNWAGGKFGFPSYHTSSSFTFAAVLDEYYGPRVGIPAYALAGLIGWSRIDERDHDLSDVLFGAALGYVIGKSVARHHLGGDSRVRLFPYLNPGDGSAGLMFESSF